VSEPDLLTVAQAAQLLGITPEAVRRRIERGTLPSVRRGSRRMLSRVDVEYAAAQADGSTIPPTVSPRVATNPGVGGSSTSGGGNRGIEESASTELVRLVSDALQRVEDATERRVIAETERDAAVERERSEREARQAAEAEIVALRAHLTQLQAPVESGDVDPSTAPRSEADGDEAEPVRNLVWWQRIWSAR
jgi:excisionase family DNA binding protein